MSLEIGKVLDWECVASDDPSVLADLQGNILKSHGREFASHLFFQFDAARSESAREWIRKIATSHLTNALRQLQDAKAFRQKKKNTASPFVALGLSAAGYAALRIPSSLWPGKRRDAFRAGMAARKETLGDRDASLWQSLFQQPIHAVLIVADDGQEKLKRVCEQIVKRAPKGVKYLGQENGLKLYNEHGETIEHFNYVDGRSQPLLLTADLEKEQNKTDGISVWNPAAPLRLALAKCPGSSLQTGYGSFLVFRKLQQHVKEFKEHEAALGKFLKLEDEERAGAFVVGRFEDGTPVVWQNEEGMRHPVPNNFTYTDDPQGRKCPFHAHVRQVNPRKTNKHDQHSLVRRGITYGERLFDPETKKMIGYPVDEVGLLFMCYQSSLETQFEYVQRRAAAPIGDLGVDPVLGDANPAPQSWPADWAKAEKKPFSFGGFVTLQGGEYFFTPSVSFLQRLPHLPES